MARAAINISFGLALSAISAQVTFALPPTPWQQTEAFAVCSGRLAALAARQAALADPEVGQTQSHRDSFDFLVEATLPAALEHGVPEGQVDRWRSQGWVEMAGLMADAIYSTDIGISERATLAAQERVSYCKQLIL